MLNAIFCVAFRRQEQEKINVRFTVQLFSICTRALGMHLAIDLLRRQSHFCGVRKTAKAST